MKQLLATLALIAALAQTGVIYPQAMKVQSVEEATNGTYIVTLCSSAGFLYSVAADSDEMVPGEMMAFIMYNNMTADDITDDAVIAMHFTGFFDRESGAAVERLKG